MIILALDTSAQAASVAVVKDGYLTGEITIRNGKTHSQKVIPMIHQLLEMLDYKPEDLDMLAVANGPGSFTGLRIGVVTIKAMAYALNLPVVEVSTLMALAYTVSAPDGLVCPVMDARNRQVYTGLYKIGNESVSVLMEDTGIAIEELVSKLRAYDMPIHFVGDAVSLYEDYILDQGIKARFAPDNIFTHRAAAVAYLAWLMQKDGKVTDAFHVVPNYLRKSQAERMKELLSGSNSNGK
ncbi:tRNA threonylcarbamoyladenosine biosynthesis protein TsaB [Thermoclostridium stercorarium subsp. thermolacticum DSM 2910]|jgi:tRNA threonylcarbamoyladenosine biosynthesis protein TsaB|uniref:tRNA threonylcarbamoyladenosine biosynthesis protein TsaB n=3 Tax=Thermoclostridium stercorarium TaxID=1510 RepID=A0A1B1YP00_THEST|nr:tRNA (adenosine(37)-N6)-threonylcarbamoyltransferase complex dimerization subunit type 1 TsaB [Thermoclostridium stercorarium]ANW99827.1 tRNA threonylcarbamoyladenosine biosynthesis protein TsaB [Thermoclostridium stercorarium subsp. thermolacticum DSM 2910]ANX02454.1 tRNA threonylcarbamoyladenosine biosynthesis protein TsaB [Thermoclostridium stercorarium subsp. leptospartum DSM 9219]